MAGQLKIFLLFFIIVCIAKGQTVTKKALTICWDTSYSMKKRQLEKELSLVDSLITTLNIIDVQLLNFSNDVQEKNFLIKKGDWSALKEELSKSTYDGATKYQNLNQFTKNDIGLVFTDGNKVFDDDFLSLDEGDILVNTSPNADYKTLRLWEFLNRINLIDYTREIKKAKNTGKRGNITGFVHADGKPLAKVLVQSSSGDSFITNAVGQFQYNGNVGDTLRIRRGNDTFQELVVDDLESEIKFFLDSKTVALDEVTVTEERIEELNLVDMGYTTMEQKKVGVAVYDISDERISEVEGTVTQVLQEVPGLLMSSTNSWDPRNSGLSTARMRGKGSMSFDPKVLVVVDGTPLQRSRNSVGEQNATYFHINPQNIKSIKVLKGLAATNLYGSEGGGGVILITTKTAAAGKKANGKTLDQARLTNNIFDGKLVFKKGQLSTPYLKELKKSTNLKAAYEMYLKQKESHLKEYWYFLDVADYFRTANTQIANKVMSNIIELPFNYEAKRTLFLKFLELGQNHQALELSELMKKSNPNHIQVYLDAARAHRSHGNYKAAAHLLNGIVTGGLNQNVDFGPLNKVAGTELRNLVNQYPEKVDLSKIDVNYKNNLTYNARLRFDWASPQNEFVLKFVNPQKRFFDWEHSSSSDKRRITSEIKNGFGTEQFELVGNMVIGKWGVYITNLSSNDSAAPYWVKCTIDYNFGKQNQRSEEKLIRLAPSDDKEQLFLEFMVE
ncbi:MAG: TonB-dependent receptor plug domain-containing protein [Bacteroidota bacterium]